MAATARPPAPPPDIALAERLLAELAARTAARRGVTRASYGPGEQVAHDILRREGQALGLAIATDAAGNLYLTLPGAAPGPGILVGSHLDSVAAGGNYDGAAGVLMGLAVAAGLRAAGAAPPADLTVMAIRAEESTWFGASYIGSRAAFGRLGGDELAGVRRSGDGLTLGAAIAAAGGDPAALARGAAFLDPARIAAFVEPHIEQGPVLEDRGLPVGIVTSIRGAFRHRGALCLGAYAHSGAAPRQGRRDAVRALARLILAMDTAWARRAAAGEDLTVTFGEIATDPDEAAFSKVAGRVAFAVDIRSDSAATLAALRAELAAAAAAIARTDGVRFAFGAETGTAPAAMDGQVTAALAAAAAAAGVPALAMPSGAGHDAAVFAGMGVPTGMLFVRNANGSHNPDEAMAMADFAAAARVLAGFCLAPPRPR